MINKFEKECGNCKKEFDRETRIKKILHCGHIICEKCITSKLKVVKKIKCMMCFEIKISGNKKKNDFSQNLAIIKLDGTDFGKNSNSEKKENQNKEKIEVFLNTVEKKKENINLTEKEIFVAKKKILKKNLNSKLSDKQKELKCQKHLKKKLEIYCIECCKKICYECGLFGDHKNHEMKTEEEFYKEIYLYAKDLEKNLKDLNKQDLLKKESFDHFLENNFLEKETKIKLEVEDYFKSILNQVQFQKKNILDKIEKLFLFQKEKCLQVFKNEMKNAIKSNETSLKEKIKISLKIIEKNDSQYLLKLMNEKSKKNLTKKCQNLKLEVDGKKDKFLFQMENFFQSIKIKKKAINENYVEIFLDDNQENNSNNQNLISMNTFNTFDDFSFFLIDHNQKNNSKKSSMKEQDYVSKKNLNFDSENSQEALIAQKPKKDIKFKTINQEDFFKEDENCEFKHTLTGSSKKDKLSFSNLLEENQDNLFSEKKEIIVKKQPANFLKVSNNKKLSFNAQKPINNNFLFFGNKTNFNKNDCANKENNYKINKLEEFQKELLLKNQIDNSKAKFNFRNPLNKFDNLNEIKQVFSPKQDKRDSEQNKKKISLNFSKNNNLKQLDLSDLKIKDQNLSQIIMLINKSPNVKILKLSNNLISDEGIKFICEQIKNLKIEKIDLINNQLTDSSISHFLNLVKNNSFIKEINLKKNFKKEENLKNIVKKFRTHGVVVLI